ncbi:hypothetical protein AVEN_137131-1 [Araneus ventricosus]|uniref:Reverse transcriptase Ty1/copia-type domain-containing protein n=1 Tax=Araneus ventricosus TaxID=182803 RepID=A0A4Y2LHY2_ARAVE|nr:hypothetical protein AVEN_137131-1 [Araneus ventricosus]
MTFCNCGMKEWVIKTKEENEPFKFQEAINSSNRKEWRDAIQEKLNSSNGNETWVLVNLPQGRKPIENRWVYKIKKTRCR